MLDIRLVTARRLATLVDALADASADARRVMLAATRLHGRARPLAELRRQPLGGGRRVERRPRPPARPLARGARPRPARGAAPRRRQDRRARTASSTSPARSPTIERDLVERHPADRLRAAPRSRALAGRHLRASTTTSAGTAGLPGRARRRRDPVRLAAHPRRRRLRRPDLRPLLPNKVSVEAAMHELQGEAGRQFDPLVVAALHDHLAAAARSRRAATPTEPAWSF